MGKPPGSTREMDRWVLRYVPTGARGDQENVYYLVAMLFACWYQGTNDVHQNPSQNLGSSLRMLVDLEAVGNNNRDEIEKRTEKRLVALMNSHLDDLPKHLQHIVSLLKSKDIPINWSQLLSDVQNWQREDREIQRRWARGFWKISHNAIKIALENNSNLEEE